MILYQILCLSGIFCFQKHKEACKPSEINPAKYNPRKDLRPGDPTFTKIFSIIEGLSRYFLVHGHRTFSKWLYCHRLGKNIR